MRKSISIILSVCLLICAMVPLNVFAVSSGDGWNYSDTVLTIDDDLSEFDYDAVPWQEYRSEIRTILIQGGTAIPNEAFKNLYNVKNVVVSTDIVSIVDETFSGCAKLAAVVLPDSVTSIGDNAFSDATAVCVGAESAFADKTGYKTYTTGAENDTTLCEGNAQIGWAVYDDDTLVISGSGNMPNHFGNDSSGSTKAPWKDYASTIKTAVVDYGVTKTPVSLLNKDRTNNAAYSALETFVVADSVTTAMRDWMAWGGDAALKRMDFSRNLTDIPQNTLTTYNSVNEIYFGQKLKGFGSNAFYATGGLERINFEDGFDGFTSDFANNVIRSAGSLREIVFPKSVTRVGNNTFFAVRNLEKIVVLNSETEFGASAFNASTTGTQTAAGKPTVYCYADSKAKTWAEATGFNVITFDNVYTHGDVNWLMNDTTQVDVAGADISADVSADNLNEVGDVVANERVKFTYDFSGGDNWSKVVIAYKTTDGYAVVKTSIGCRETEFTVPTDAFGKEMYAFVLPMNSAGECGDAKVLSLGTVRNEFDNSVSLTGENDKLNGLFRGTYARDGEKTVLAVLCQYTADNIMIKSTAKTAVFETGVENEISYVDEPIDEKTARAVLYIWECKDTEEPDTATFTANITVHTTMSAVADCVEWNR